MSDLRKAAAVGALAIAACLAVPVYGWLAGRDRAAPAGRAAVLETHLDRSPADARAWVFLARERMDADRFQAAADAYSKAIAASPKVARDPRIWCELADALGMAQGGKLAGKPHEAVGQALALKPDEPCALEIAGSAALEAGDRPAARRHWQALLAQLEPGTRRHTELSAAIERLRHGS